MHLIDDLCPGWRFKDRTYIYTIIVRTITRNAATIQNKNYLPCAAGEAVFKKRFARSPGSNRPDHDNALNRLQFFNG
jgi:hypothetical protein